MHFLGTALLDYTVNGRLQERVGNRDLHMARSWLLRELAKKDAP